MSILNLIDSEWNAIEPLFPKVRQNKAFREMCPEFSRT